MRRILPLLMVIALVGMMIGASSAVIARRAKPNVTDWRQLIGTTWIVPKTNLPAASFDASTQIISFEKDQTVYQITGYRDGYFWGPTAAKLGNGPIVCKSMFGSITPQGQVMLLFTQVLQNGQTMLNQGFGQMIKQGNQWTMQNQTGTDSMAHWAYMVQSTPKDSTWRSLPGVGMSVEEFMSGCPAGPQPAK
jgi:hypothetical protein